MSFYIVKTNPHQKGDYGGTAYTQSLIFTKLYFTPEDLRILVNKYLNIPFYALWIPSYEDPKEYSSNIEIEEIKFNLLNHKELVNKVNDKYTLKGFYTVNYIGKGDEFYKNFPENFEFTEWTKERMLEEIDNVVKNLKVKEKVKEQESLEQQFKNILNKLDKETILKMMLENTK